MKRIFKPVLGLLFCAFCVSLFKINSGAQNPTSVPQGAVSHGLTATLALVEPARFGETKLRLTLRNTGSQETLVKLGWMSNPQIPSGLRLTLADATGKKWEFVSADGPVAGAVRPHSVTLSPAATQTFTLDWDKFMTRDASKSNLTPGDYRLAARLEGNAAQSHDGKKIANSSWKVALTSNELNIRIQPQIVLAQ